MAPSAHHTFSKMTSCHGSFSNDSSLKSLAQWVLRMTSSKPHLLDTLYDSWNWIHTVNFPKLELVPQKRARDTEAPVYLLYLWYAGGIVGDAFQKEKIALLVFGSFDSSGSLQLAGSTYIHAYHPSSKKPTRRVSFDYSIGPPSSLKYPHLVLNFSLYLYPVSRFLYNFKNTARHVEYYIHQRVKCLFNFFRYIYPRGIQSSRKVLLETDEFQITHIGKGAFATISRVVYKPTGEARAMKRITFDGNGLAKYLARNEIDTLKAMKNSKWFPPLLNDFTDGEEYVVTMPFYCRGDMSTLLECKGYLSRELAQFYSAELVIAIHSLHKVGIIHRDIKTDNIFLDEEGHLVLADLGLAENIATFEGGEDMMKGYEAWFEAREKGGDDFPFLWVNHLNPLGTCGAAGTFWYTAPEVFRKEPYSFGTDYWSVGVIYHELLTGHIPFNHYKPYPENKRPMLDFRCKPGQLKDIFPWEEEALTQLLNPRPDERPRTLTEYKKNAIFRGVDWEKMEKREVHPPLLPPPLLED